MISEFGENESEIDSVDDAEEDDDGYGYGHEGTLRSYIVEVETCVSQTYPEAKHVICLDTMCNYTLTYDKSLCSNWCEREPVKIVGCSGYTTASLEGHNKLLGKMLFVPGLKRTLLS